MCIMLSMINLSIFIIQHRPALITGVYNKDRLLNSVTMSFIFPIKCYINKRLDSLKFKDLRKCEANTYGRPCLNYTQLRNRYCEEHHHLLKLTCEAYHYIGRGYEDISQSTVAWMELSMRNAYVTRFNITADYGHNRWKEHLTELASQQPEYSVSHEVLEMRNYFLDEVFKGDPDPQARVFSELNIDICARIRNYSISDWSVDYNNEQQAVNRYNINLHYFNTCIFNPFSSITRFTRPKSSII